VKEENVKKVEKPLEETEKSDISTENKKGKQTSQPKQNKPKEVVVNLNSSENSSDVQQNKVVFPESMFQPISQVDLKNDQEFPSLVPGAPTISKDNKEDEFEKEIKKESPKKATEKPMEDKKSLKTAKSNKEFTKNTQKNKGLKERRQTDPNKVEEEEKAKNDQKSKQKVREIETKTIKLYSRHKTQEKGN